MLNYLLSFSTISLSILSASTEVGAMNQYRVNVYECDDNLEILSLENRQKKVQGIPVRICFAPDEAARSDGIGIESVKSWSWETSFKGGEAKQNAVIEGKGDGALSSLRCNDEGNLCVLDTMLTSKFYQNAGSVFGLGEVTFTSGAGTISVQKDLFQTNFEFKFTHGPGGEEMTPEETQELLKVMSEQRAEAAALKENSVNEEMMHGEVKQEL
jgi:hypothetical protein